MFTEHTLEVEIAYENTPGYISEEVPYAFVQASFASREPVAVPDLHQILAAVPRAYLHHQFYAETADEAQLEQIITQPRLLSLAAWYDAAAVSIALMTEGQSEQLLEPFQLMKKMVGRYLGDMQPIPVYGEYDLFGMLDDHVHAQNLLTASWHELS